jgi:hypothetical protein
MNKLVLTTLVAALSGVFAAPTTARAGDGEVVAAIGGFIGGVIVGSTIDRDHDHRHDRGGAVHVEVRTGRHGHGHGHRHGYWDTTRVRVWVPGRWVVTYDRCGERVRYFERGRYEWRRERVWVPTHDRRRCEHDHCR